MPTYEYECVDCGHSFELFQSMKDEPCRVCPECRGEVKRCIGTGSGILFKGTGFYQTDYRSESYRRDASKETAPKEKSSTGGSSSDKKAG